MFKFTVNSNLVDIFLVVSLCLVPSVESIAFDEVSSLQIWITVSSLARKDPNNNKALLFRQLELNWINAPNEDPNDYLALYLDSQPGDDNKLPVSVHRLNGRMSGQLTCDHYLPLIDFFNETSSWDGRPDDEAAYHAQYFGPRGQQQQQPADIGPDGADFRWRAYSGQPAFGKRTNTGTRRRHQLTSECLGYCVAYHSRGKMLAKSCLQTEPSWMEDSFQYIGSRALPTLMLPGTHNSATYARQLDKSVLQMINKYQLNQDESVFNQLVYGIRYLDLRVGYAKVKQRINERLWIYHDIFRTEIALSDVFKQVARFLDLTSHEIVIMDFHRFTVGFQNETPAVQRERHARLIEMLFKHLHKYIIPSYLGQHAPLQEYVSMGKRLLVSYADRAALVGAQADQHSNIFALYTQQAAGTRQLPVRDIDAVKQDQEDLVGSAADNNNNNNNRFGLLDNNKQEQPAEPQADRRMATRIYNKLKSLKLISHSFSKRATTTDNDGDGDGDPDDDGGPLADRKPSKWTPAGAASLPAAELQRQQQQPEEQNDQDEGRDRDGQQDDDLSIVARAALFFPQVRHLWPNRDTIEGLAQYMNETTCRKYFGELRSMMVELTPTVFGAISDKYDGNRRLAQLANRQVTDWIRDRWLHCVNIVASDYFLGNDLIRLAIQANKMRQLHRSGGGGASPASSPLSAMQDSNRQQCRSFRRIEHLLDKSKVGQQFVAVAHGQHHEPPSNLITHTTRDGNRILLKPLGSKFSSYSWPASNSSPAPHSQWSSSWSSSSSTGQQSRERRDSFVDNVSEGFADLFTSFKRLLNL